MAGHVIDEMRYQLHIGQHDITIHKLQDIYHHYICLHPSAKHFYTRSFLSEKIISAKNSFQLQIYGPNPAKAF